MNPFFAHDSLGTAYPLPLNSMVQLVGGFLFLAAGIYAYFHLKKATSLCKRRNKSTNHLNILETRPLGNRQFLLVVTYEQEKFLIGVSPNGLQFLSRLKVSPTKSPFGIKDK